MIAVRLGDPANFSDGGDIVEGAYPSVSAPHY